MSVFDTLSPAVVEALRASGWSADRKIPVDQWDQGLQQEGFYVSDLAREVLEGLFDLRIPPVVKGRNWATLHFEPALAGEGSLDIAEQFERLFGQRFYPIALWISGCCVYLGENGKVVTYDDVERLDVGDTFADAMDVMLLATREPTVIAEDAFD